MAKQPAYKRYTRSRIGNAIFFTFFLLMGLFSLLPLVYCICTSLKPLDELLVFPPRFFVYRPTLENFLQLPILLESLEIPFSRYLFNSVFVSIVSTVLQLFVASLAAYVLSKTKLPGRRIYFLIIQFSLLYNGTTLAVPQYLIFSEMKLLDTYWIYILPVIASSTGVFLMKQFIDSSVPDTLLEAARIDGAGPMRIYWSIVMPNIKPAVMTQLLFAFQGIWSMTATTGTIFSERLKTLPAAVSSIGASGIARSGAAMAAAVLMLIPPILVYFISQSNVMETMSSAGIKE